jgi:hypothetical protein
VAPAATADCDGEPCDQQPLRVRVVNPPAPAPAAPVWTWQEKIAWGANIVLALLGYAGIMMAVSTLRKIERQTRAAESAAEALQSSAQAAVASAKAALLNAQAVIDAERPWILIAVEPTLSVENSFTVTATNRGRSPARIVSTFERIKIAADEAHLPLPPDFEEQEPRGPIVPIILLPGESKGLRGFARNDARTICESDEAFHRVETWEERIYLYGKVLYRDLISPADKQDHETDWCCWYIHGRQNSGLVMAGPPEYNRHT